MPANVEIKARRVDPAATRQLGIGPGDLVETAYADMLAGPSTGP